MGFLTGVKGLRGRVDALAQAVATIDSAHMRVHDGLMYQVAGYDDSLANDANLDIGIWAPSNGGYHMRISASCGGDAELGLHENNGFVLPSPAIGDLIPANRSRRSSKTTPVQFFLNPTLGSPEVGSPLGGTLFVPGGTGGASSGGRTAFEMEWNMQPGLQYLIRLTNRAGIAQAANIIVDYYHNE